MTRNLTKYHPGEITGKKTSLSAYLKCMNHHFWISNWKLWLRWIHAPAQHLPRGVSQSRTVHTSSRFTGCTTEHCIQSVGYKHSSFLGTLTFRRMSTILCWYSTAFLSFLKSSKVCKRQNTDTLSRIPQNSKHKAGNAGLSPFSAYP